MEHAESNGLDMERLLRSGSHFRRVSRFRVHEIEDLGDAIHRVEETGRPISIASLDRLPTWNTSHTATISPEWLSRNYGDTCVSFFFFVRARSNSF